MPISHITFIVTPENSKSAPNIFQVFESLLLTNSVNLHCFATNLLYICGKIVLANYAKRLQ